MKKNILSIFSLCALMGLSGCNAFLELEPLDKVSPDQLLETEGGVKALLANIYTMIPMEDFNYRPNAGFNQRGYDGVNETTNLAFLTDEATRSDAKPQGSEEELSKVKDVLGTFSTNYASSAAGRKANIANGSKKINGSVIYPGEEFSVYQTVAPFNADNGYKLAGAYETVPLWMHMVVESVRYLLPCIMQSFVQNWK